MVQYLKMCRLFEDNETKGSNVLHITPTFTRTVNPPPFPILNANDAPTERSSEVVDHFLQPYLLIMKPHVKDPTGFGKVIKYKEIFQALHS